MTNPKHTDTSRSDLVERLRYTAEHGIFTAHDNGMQAMPDEAADRIEALEAENERLRGVLTMIAHHIRDESDPYEEDYWGCRSIARAALAGDSHD